MMMTVNLYFASGGCKVLWWICLFVCLSVHIARKPHGQASPNCVCVFPMGTALAWSSSDGVAIRYVLSVLRMTSCFHTMGPMGQNQARRYLQNEFTRWRYQLDIRQRGLQCLVEFIRTRHWGQSLLLRLNCFLYAFSSKVPHTPVSASCIWTSYACVIIIWYVPHCYWRYVALLVVLWCTCLIFGVGIGLDPG